MDNKADPNIKDNENNTALHHVVNSKYGNPDKKLMIAGLLVKSGANIHSRNQKGMTAIEIAKKNNLEKIASLLEKSNN